MGGVGFTPTLAWMASLEPPVALEQSMQHDAHHADDRQDREVAVSPAKFGHVVEVHAVDACNGGRHKGYGCPGGDLAHVLVLANGDRVLAHTDAGEVRLQNVSEQAVDGLDGVSGPEEVVVHVPEVRSARGGCTGDIAISKRLEWRIERQGRSPELGDLSLACRSAGVVSSAPLNTCDSISSTSCVIPAIASSYPSTTWSAVRYSTTADPRSASSLPPASARADLTKNVGLAVLTETTKRGPTKEFVIFAYIDELLKSGCSACKF